MLTRISNDQDPMFVADDMGVVPQLYVTFYLNDTDASAHDAVVAVIHAMYSGVVEHNDAAQCRIDAPAEADDLAVMNNGRTSGADIETRAVVAINTAVADTCFGAYEKQTVSQVAPDVGSR